MRPTVLCAFGAVLGLLSGVVWLIDVQDVGVMVGGVTLTAVVGGLLSVRFGRRFWEWVARWGRWIVP